MKPTTFLASGLESPFCGIRLASINTTAQLLECLQSRALTTPRTGKNVEQQELSYIAGGNAKWSGLLEKSLAVSYKVQQKLSCDAAIPHLGIYLREIKMYIQTKTCM